MSSRQACAATIAILRPAQSSPAVNEALFRLQGELLAVGLQVEVARRPPGASSDGSDTGDSNAWLETIVAERRIDAVVAVVGHTKPVAVDVWIVEHSTRSLRLSRVALDPNAANAPAILAIRAIEVLRSNFLVVDVPQETPRTVRAAPATHGPAPARLGPFALEAGASLFTSLDGVGPALLPLVRFDWTLSAPLVAQATLAGLGTRPSVETQAGGVRIAQQHALLGLCFCPPSASLLRPVFSVAAGVSRTSLDGWADSPNRGHDLDRWAVLLDGSIGGRLRIYGRYHLGFAADVQLARPSAAIHFVDEQVATTGRPNVLLSLTVGARL
jgi:hypothetical protein